MMLFFLVIAVCSKKDLGIFMKMGSFGAIFVTMLMIFIIGTGVMGLTQT